MPAARLSFAGDLVAGAPRDEVRRKVRASTDEYLVAPRPEGGTLVARLDGGDRGRVVRFLVGAASPDHVPEKVVVAGRPKAVGRPRGEHGRRV